MQVTVNVQLWRCLHVFGYRSTIPGLQGFMQYIHAVHTVGIISRGQMHANIEASMGRSGVTAEPDSRPLHFRHAIAHLRRCAGMQKPQP